MEWTRGPTLGRGSSAAVSLAAATSGEIFAVKSTDLSSSSLLQREEILISQLSSPYIIKCLGSDITREENKPTYNLFMEYIAGGTLSDHIRKHGGSIGEDAIRFYARQILLGLDYIHGEGIVHCDIKGQNILIGDDNVKIADFGCAKWNDCGDCAAFAGTPAYMAPEVARGEEQGFAADIWALGCTVVEMATGSNPWPEMKDPASALYRIAFSGDVPEFRGEFSDGAKDFVAKCLMRVSKERWTAAELLKHPFFSSGEEKWSEIRKSPTSVMEQGFWNDLEESDPSRSCTGTDSVSDSPSGRVGALIGDVSNFPDWTAEEDWLTVRCNEIEENSKIENYEDLFDGEEEIFISIGVENSLLDCFNYEISNIVDEHGCSTFQITHSDGVKYEIVSRIIIEFEKLLMELFLHLFLSFFINFMTLSALL
ncbi:hypothetical protein BUALT_Bualt18G0068500 [Buddleja alternifolia]|uniref:Protein kinase domain-containing protein n=1 Tax=Buddleja alternifolia TaxID=168488 RepID=A0AAV6W500_9LAMI|nr:hypothetical protein BUALT_Bualt18G0068500 [Buddleja alternifolia]